MSRLSSHRVNVPRHSLGGALQTEEDRSPVHHLKAQGVLGELRAQEDASLAALRADAEAIIQAPHYKGVPNFSHKRGNVLGGDLKAGQLRRVFSWFKDGRVQNWIRQQLPKGLTGMNGKLRVRVPGLGILHLDLHEGEGFRFATISIPQTALEVADAR